MNKLGSVRQVGHEPVVNVRPYDSRRWSSVAWSTVSKAADRSRSVNSEMSPLLTARRMSGNTFSTAVSVE